jgi:hypothetical protein
MVDWASIPQTILLTMSNMLSNWWEIVLVFIAAIIAAIIVDKFSLLKYFKKLYEWLLIRIKQLTVFIQLFPRLWMISYNNSKNFSSMINLNLHNDFYSCIKPEDKSPSPHLEFNFSIINCSVFDLKVKKIHMEVFHENTKLEPYEYTKEMYLPHQQILSDRFEYPLHENFINILKSLKKEGKRNTLRLHFTEVKIDFNGDKEFSKPWYNSTLEIPMDRVNVSL